MMEEVIDLVEGESELKVEKMVAWDKGLKSRPHHLLLHHSCHCCNPQASSLLGDIPSSTSNFGLSDMQLLTLCSLMSFLEAITTLQCLLLIII